MKVLMMFPYAPLPPPHDLGGTKRNLPFLQENLKRNEVSVLSYGTPEEEREFRQSFDHLCADIRFVNRKRPRIVNGIEQLWLLATARSPFRQMYRGKMQRELDELTSRTPFDVIHCCTQLLGYFRFPKGVPVVSDTHEVTYDLLYRTFKTTKDLIRKLLSYLSYRLGKRDEVDLCMKFDAVIAATERDYTVFRGELPHKKIFVIENGVGPAFFESQNVAPEPGALVFTGKMSYYPNIHGIVRFLDEIFPLILLQAPHAKVYVVGAYPPQHLRRRASRNVIVTGFVEDVRPYIARGEVFLIPLWIGGGIRGKALEAMAMRKPIVTTSIGCEGLNLAQGDSALFGNTPTDFAAAVLRLLNDRALRTRLAEKAYNHVTSRFNWSIQGKKLQGVYDNVIRERMAPQVFMFSTRKSAALSYEYNHPQKGAETS